MSQCERCGHDPGFPVAVCSSCGFGGADQSSFGAASDSGAATVMAQGRRSPRRQANPDATVMEQGRRMLEAPDGYLFVREGPNKGLQVGVGETTTIGRDPSNSLCVQDKRVSGQHAIIRKSQRGYVFQDLLGTNGTYFLGPGGELRLTGPHRLGDGDRLRMGHTVIQFIASDGGR